MLSKAIVGESKNMHARMSSQACSCAVHAFQGTDRRRQEQLDAYRGLQIYQHQVPCTLAAGTYMSMCVIAR
jgi:hypothetical protein